MHKDMRYAEPRSTISLLSFGRRQTSASPQSAPSKGAHTAKVVASSPIPSSYPCSNSSWTRAYYSIILW